MRWLYCLTALLLFSCAPESVNRYHTAENENEVVSLLNERKFEKAIWLIENREGKFPKGRMGFLLGQAYLGKAGIEPLAFAAKVAESEPQTEAATVLFPNCPKGRLSSVQKSEMKCLVKRVYLLAPAANDPDFTRARRLLREAYPNPAESPEWVNTLIGMVETISLVKRTGDVFLFAKGMRNIRSPLDFRMGDVRWLQAEGKEAMNDAREALSRANHSGDKVSRFLSGTKATQWFEQVENTVAFAKEVGLSRFLDFVRENLLSSSDEIRHGELLDKLKVAMEQIEKE